MNLLLTKVAADQKSKQSNPFGSALWPDLLLLPLHLRQATTAACPKALHIRPSDACNFQVTAMGQGKKSGYEQENKKNG